MVEVRGRIPEKREFVLFNVNVLPNQHSKHPKNVVSKKVRSKVLLKLFYNPEVSASKRIDGLYAGR